MDHEAIIHEFAVLDCNLARQATGRVCSNLRELLELVRTAPEAVLEHHMMRCALEDYFELYEFPNDFARWCWAALGDQVLGEQLGLADPYRLPSVAALRSTLVDMIEDRLWRLDRVPWCRPGLELHAVQSRLIAYDTGQKIHTPAELLEAIERMSLRSLFFHVHEARRRTGGATDDFSAWVEGLGTHPGLVARLRGIDFYFLNLNELRDGLLDALRQHLGEASPAAGSKP